MNLQVPAVSRQTGSLHYLRDSRQELYEPPAIELSRLIVSRADRERWASLAQMPRTYGTTTGTPCLENADVRSLFGMWSFRWLQCPMTSPIST